MWSRGEGVSDNFLRHSLPSCQTRGFPTRPCPDWSADVAAVPGLSSFGAGRAVTSRAGGSRHRLWHVWSESQSLSDSQTNSFKHPRDYCKLSSQDTPGPWSALSSVDKYGLAEPETRWCNSPSRASSSSSLTFKSEHDYLKVRPHHSFRYWGIKKKKLWLKNVWGSGRGRQFYA